MMDAESRLELIELLVRDKAWDAVVKIGQSLLDHYYPADMFDSGPEYIVALRNALARLQD